MTDCIFCKIIRGEIPCDKVYENDKVLAFLDISPVNKGHTIVIPKKHSENLLDADEQTLCELIKAVKKLSIAIKKAVKADGINIGINNFKAAGQLVPHFHIHIMPRFENDGLKIDWPTKKLDNMEKIAESIKKLI